MNTTLDPQLIHILQHALGLTQPDSYGRYKGYRNYFVTGPGSKDYDHCQAAVAAGLMDDRGGRGHLAATDHVFTVTDAGRSAARAALPPPPQLTRSQLRYRQFRDADSSYSFRVWLGIQHRSRAARERWNARGCR